MPVRKDSPRTKVNKSERICQGPLQIIQIVAASSVRSLFAYFVCFAFAGWRRQAVRLGWPRGSGEIILLPACQFGFDRPLFLEHWGFFCASPARRLPGKRAK